MIEVGRLCMKIAGRDAGNACVIVDILDSKFVLIDGNVRRRKCNITHLEPLDKVIEIRKGASHETVAKAFKELKLPVWEKKKKEAKPKQVKKRKSKPKSAPKKKAVPKKKSAKEMIAPSEAKKAE